MDGTIASDGRAARANPALRPFLLAFGWLNVGLGVIGALLPVMPTTVFLLIALWAFSKSSRRFHRWLYTHPKLGPTLWDWHEHRVIPTRAKVLALSTMAASLAYVSFGLAQSWALPAGLACVLGAVALFIVTRPSAPRTARP